MAIRQGTRKRVQAPRRAADGSAFEKCDECGIMVAVALFDMHECGEKKREVKRFKGISSATHRTDSVNPIRSFDDQPRSAFVCFVEWYRECYGENLMDSTRKCFEMWKSMTAEERKPCLMEAAEVDSAYLKKLDDEAKTISKVDDEADSSMVGKFDKFYELYSNETDCSDHYDSSDYSGHERSDNDAPEGY